MTIAHSIYAIILALVLPASLVAQAWRTMDIKGNTIQILANHNERLLLVSDFSYRGGFHTAYTGVGCNIYALDASVPRHVAIINGDIDSYRPGSRFRTAYRHDSGLVFCFYHLSDIPSYTEVVTFPVGSESPRIPFHDVRLEVICRNGTGIGQDIRDGHYSSQRLRYDFFTGAMDSVDIEGCPDDSLRFDLEGESVGSSSTTPYGAIIIQKPSSSLRLVSTDMGASWSHFPVPTSFLDEGYTSAAATFLADHSVLYVMVKDSTTLVIGRRLDDTTWIQFPPPPFRTISALGGASLDRIAIATYPKGRVTYGLHVVDSLETTVAVLDRAVSVDDTHNRHPSVERRMIRRFAFYALATEQPWTMYSLHGQYVASATSATISTDMAPGVYILRHGTTTTVLSVVP